MTRTPKPMAPFVSRSASVWPRKYDVIGIQISATTYDEALTLVMAAARSGRSACVAHLPVHGVVEGSRNPELGAELDAFEIVAPDGQPVRMALNCLHGTALPDRCYGPEFMLRVCRRVAEEGIGIYLYGSYPPVVEALRTNLLARFPSLRIVGAEAGYTSPLTPEEDDALVSRINASGCGVLFVGLGCPKQERFAYAHRGRIRAVQICVGAAFDFHAGTKKMAPPWMQRHSLEWLFRLMQEPRRLAGRYLTTNTIFLLKFSWQLVRHVTKAMWRSIHAPAYPVAVVTVRPNHRENPSGERGSVPEPGTRTR